MKDLDTQIFEEAHLAAAIGEALKSVINVRQLAKDMELLNSQIYLDFEDKLNQLSVADPNK